MSKAPPDICQRQGGMEREKGVEAKVFFLKGEEMSQTLTDWQDLAGQRKRRGTFLCSLNTSGLDLLPRRGARPNQVFLGNGRKQED